MSFKNQVECISSEIMMILFFRGKFVPMQKVRLWSRPFRPDYAGCLAAAIWSLRLFCCGGHSNRNNNGHSQFLADFRSSAFHYLLWSRRRGCKPVAERLLRRQVQKVPELPLLSPATTPGLKEIHSALISQLCLAFNQLIMDFEYASGRNV